jgi:hypothetical protein
MASDQVICLLSTQSTMPTTMTTYLVQGDEEQPWGGFLWIDTPLVE